MRAKLLLLAGEPASESLSLSIQEVLTELAVAFGHAFLIKEERIGAASRTAFGAALTQEAVDQAAACSAVLCVSHDPGDHVALAGGLNAVLGIRELSLPQALADSSLMANGVLPRGRLMFPMRTDSQTMLQAARMAHALAGESKDRLTQIPFTGVLGESWQAANTALGTPLTDGTREVTLPEALFGLTRAPSDLGHIYGNPSACEALEAAAVGISGLPRACFFSAFWADKPVLYSIVIDGDASDTISPFGALFACAQMLRTALGLTREADCLYSSIINVLEAGWRTADMMPKELPRIGTAAACKLISEQIALAGQLIIK